MNAFRLQVYIALRLSRHRLATAAMTRPQWRDWGLAVGLLAVFSAIVLPLGFWTHWLTLTPAAIPWPQSGWLAGRVLVIPALLEEGFWRVLLLPHRTEIMSFRQRWLIGLPILSLFVLMHVVTSLTVYPEGFPTFTNPLFLFSALLLGLMCTISYWQSGSWWIPVAIHWLIVFIWLMFLGGYSQLKLAYPVNPPNPNITSAFHIHQGDPNENGPFQYALAVMLDDTGYGGQSRGEYTLTAEQLQALNDGMLYVDLHTTRHQGGELRGILLPG